MCLKDVTEVYDPPLKNVKVGYKVFFRFNTEVGKLYYWYYDKYGGPQEQGWNEDKNDYLITSESEYQYSTGYHIFDDLSAIRIRKTGYSNSFFKIEVYKVEYTNIVAKGMNLGIGKTEKNLNLCFVARKFRLLEQIDPIRWKYVRVAI